MMVLPQYHPHNIKTQRLLKERCTDGRTYHGHKRKQDPIVKAIQQADLDTLKQSAQEGHLVLKYLDEWGFCLWSPVSYSRIGEQKRIEQTQKRWGKRINLLGLHQSCVVGPIVNLFTFVSSQLYL
jgi:hypothetical protein